MEIVRTKVKDLLKMEAGVEVLAKGWVRTKRGNKEIAFIALNDGSTIKNIQIVNQKNNVQLIHFCDIQLFPDAAGDKQCF